MKFNFVRPYVWGTHVEYEHVEPAAAPSHVIFLCACSWLAQIDQEDVTCPLFDQAMVPPPASQVGKHIVLNPQLMFFSQQNVSNSETLQTPVNHPAGPSRLLGLSLPGLFGTRLPFALPSAFSHQSFLLVPFFFLNFVLVFIVKGQNFKMTDSVRCFQTCICCCCSAFTATGQNTSCV